MDNNNKKHQATMLRSCSNLSQGLGRVMHITRWVLYDHGRELGLIEVLVKVNQKGEATTLAPHFIPKAVPNV